MHDEFRMQISGVRRRMTHRQALLRLPSNSIWARADALFADPSLSAMHAHQGPSDFLARYLCLRSTIKEATEFRALVKVNLTYTRTSGTDTMKITEMLCLITQQNPGNLEPNHSSIFFNVIVYLHTPQMNFSCACK